MGISAGTFFVLLLLGAFQGYTLFVFGLVLAFLSAADVHYFLKQKDDEGYKVWRLSAEGAWGCPKCCACFHTNLRVVPCRQQSALLEYCFPPLHYRQSSPPPSLPSSTATRSKSCTTNTLNAYDSAASTARRRAKQAASALVFGQEVTLQTHGHDKYGRTLADVLLPDGINVNHELLKEGWCWWYRTYAPGNAELEKLESEAREAKRGLWSDPQPVPPWEWSGELLNSIGQHTICQVSLRAKQISYSSDHLQHPPSVSAPTR